MSQKEQGERGEGFFYDFLAWLPSGAQTFSGRWVSGRPTASLDQGLGRQPKEVVDTADGEGGCFPFVVAEVGSRIKIEEAQATDEADRQSILQYVRSGGGVEELNRRVRSR